MTKVEFVVMPEDIGLKINGEWVKVKGDIIYTTDWPTYFQRLTSDWDAETLDKVKFFIRIKDFPDAI